MQKGEFAGTLALCRRREALMRVNPRTRLVRGLTRNKTFPLDSTVSSDAREHPVREIEYIGFFIIEIVNHSYSLSRFGFFAR
jgi:hypothetical protein